MPDAVGERARRAAARAGMNFSEFMSHAAVEYAKRFERDDLVEAIDIAVDSIAGRDESTRTAVSAARDTVLGSEW